MSAAIFTVRRWAACFAFILGALVPGVAGAQSAGTYRLDVAFDLAHLRLMGTADILLARPGRVEVDLGELKILSIEADGHPVAVPADAGAPIAISVRRLVGLINAESEGAVTAALETMPNLWRFSRVVLRAGRVIEKTVADTPRGIRRRIVL